MVHKEQDSTNVGIVFTDLDGTLLNSERKVSANNLTSLNQLGENGIVRVIATGRSHYSFTRVIDASFPADYLIFSSGAGILDLQSGELLFSANLTDHDVADITCKLQEEEADFMVHHQVPDNHHFVYQAAGGGNKDFRHRIDIYRAFAREFGNGNQFPAPAAQIIAVLEHDTRRFTRLTSCFGQYQVTRTTSPLDHHSMWMEIHPHNIHKGSAAAWLCNHLDIDPAHSLGIGNDYNDLDLLDFTAQSYLLKNGPAEIHNRYCLARSNDEDGFCHAVRHGLSIL
ncbi:HAD family hydrolase [Desulfopila aestuarii]|uniref:Uncharacterized protein n=1 Tax=Desulfopila aestuarii DSM 18488 TaxID=1121416 RepID=A0A1M7YBL9_9BACT|nr:HAD family hydrolase [Desulfopila aestuarii]SHO49966.1 hypothetical protein SAMN02745220_03189 [Desulfopila aestuarii DSM 18488]